MEAGSVREVLEDEVSLDECSVRVQKKKKRVTDIHIIVIDICSTYNVAFPPQSLN